MDTWNFILLAVMAGLLFQAVRGLKARKAQKEAHQPVQNEFKPLTKEQRKGLADVLGPVSKQSASRWTGSTDKDKPATATRTRAIREGWSIGMVGFLYIDADGFASDRTVIVHSVTDDYLKGECMDRKAERTFRLDRISGDVVNHETGELIDPLELGAVLDY